MVKPANESGGYGIVIGPAAGPEALAVVAQRIEQHPPNWVAQPVLSLSTMPTLCDGTVAPRHVDLRPFTLLGPEGAYVTPGGLTRVARQPGSLIVNSSQGGGSKDTWIVDAALADAEGPGVPVGGVGARRQRAGPRRPRTPGAGGVGADPAAPTTGDQ